MSTPPRKAENMTEHMDMIQKSVDKLLSFCPEDATETEMLRSRIDEQSNLICILKQRADELLLRWQAQQKINTELENSLTDCQKELDDKIKRAELLEERTVYLANVNKSIIAFMEEYKDENAQLKIENKHLQSENDSLFSQKLQDKEVCVQKLMQDIKLLTEEYTNKENEYREKLAGYESKLLEQAKQHQAKEASLLDQLHDAQQQQRDAALECKNMKMKLGMAEEKHVLNELNARKSIASLTQKKDEVLSLSIERGRVIQEKQGEIQQLERKWKEEKKCRAEAEDRFEREAQAVNANVKVKSLQCALDESTRKYEKLVKDFEAFKEHSTSLLTQERELNKKIRHMIG